MKIIYTILYSAIFWLSTTIAYGQFIRTRLGTLEDSVLNSTSCSLVDFDGDSLVDIFITNQSDRSILYKNMGGGDFKVVEDSSSILRTGHNASWADYNNDGLTDVFIVGGQDGSYLYLNQAEDGFREILTDNIADYSISDPSNVAWGDVNLDGYVDVFITDGNGHSPGRENIILINNSDGTFSHGTGEYIPLESANDFSKNVNFVDTDNDGDLDIYITNNQFVLNDYFYINDGTGYFTKVTGGILADDKSASLTSSWGDFDNDGDVDVFVSGDNGGKNKLFANQGENQFEKLTESVIYLEDRPDNRVRTHTSSNWIDYDNDGYLDLFVTRAIGVIYEVAPNLLYRNNGNGTFEKIDTLSITTDETISAGSAWGDFDKDGDLDLVIANYNENNYIYWNEGNSNHWFYVRLRGTISNTSAIGAKIKLKASNQWQTRHVESLAGSSSQNSPFIHFGLGSATEVDSLIIEWPSGNIQSFHALSVDTILEVDELIAGKAVVCQGAVTKYSSSYISNNYHWEVDGGSIISGQDTNEIEVYWDDVNQGAIDLRVDGIISKVPIQVLPSPNPTIYGDTSACVLGDEKAYSTEFYKDHSYTWQVEGGIITSGQFLSSISIIWTNAGKHRLTVTESIDSTKCSRIAELAIEVYESPESTLVFEDSTLTVSESEGYQWYRNNVEISESEGGKNRTLVPTESGNYHVEVFNAQNCSAYSETYPFKRIETDNDTTLITSVTNSYYDDAVTVFPNPTTGTVHINTNSLNRPSEVILRNIQGKIISRSSVNSYVFVPIQIKIPSHKGIYFLEIYSQDFRTTKRIIKQ